MNIDPNDKISSHFTFKEALWLPSWNRMGGASDGLDQAVLDRLTNLCNKMDLVREYFGQSVHVHVTWRPAKYNAEIGGAKNSAHCAAANMDAAMDFHVDGLDCDQARSKILQDNKLEEWGMRMEDLPGSSWVHLDSREPLPGHPRFFKP